MGCGCLIALVVVAVAEVRAGDHAAVHRQARVVHGLVPDGRARLRVPAVHDGASTPCCTRPFGGVSGFGWFLVALGFVLDMGIVVRRRPQAQGVRSLTRVCRTRRGRPVRSPSIGIGAPMPLAGDGGVTPGSVGRRGAALALAGRRWLSRSGEPSTYSPRSRSKAICDTGVVQHGAVAARRRIGPETSATVDHRRCGAPSAGGVCSCCDGRSYGWPDSTCLSRTGPLPGALDRSAQRVVLSDHDAGEMQALGSGPNPG